MDISPFVGMLAVGIAFIGWFLIKGNVDPETKRVDEETARILREYRERRRK